MTSNNPLIEAMAREFHLEVRIDPFHGARGVELQKRIGNSLACVGYLLGPEKTEIYRLHRNQRDEFFRNKLWFFWGWLIKPHIQNNQYEVLQSLQSSEFDERFFVELARRELLPG